MNLPANSVLMIRPLAFSFNSETAESNEFQYQQFNQELDLSQLLALKEFDSLANVLVKETIDVLIYQDTPHPPKPDAIFPNNWFCTLPDKRMFVFPMYAKSRQNERRLDLLHDLAVSRGYFYNDSLLKFEYEGRALEGTGSLVFDHPAKTAYAALSKRTDPYVLTKFSEISGYSIVHFRAFGSSGKPVFHTNMALTIGPTFAIIGSDCIHQDDAPVVLRSLKEAGKKILKLNNKQIFTYFAGNTLVLSRKDGKLILVMSKGARDSLDSYQLRTITEDFGCHIVSVPVSTIEKVGGGGVRCMLTELC